MRAAIEIGLIALSVLGVYALGLWKGVDATFLGIDELSRIVLAGAVILLGQGLIRDVSLLLFRRRGTGAPKKAQCFCLESTVGLTGVVLGLGLLFAGVTMKVALGPIGTTLFVGTILIVGFIVKDYVLAWGPWRIRKDPDHMNIIPTWSK